MVKHPYAIGSILVWVLSALLFWFTKRQVPKKQADEMSPAWKAAVYGVAGLTGISGALAIFLSLNAAGADALISSLLASGLVMAKVGLDVYMDGEDTCAKNGSALTNACAKFWPVQAMVVGPLLAGVCVYLGHLLAQSMGLTSIRAQVAAASGGVAGVALIKGIEVGTTLASKAIRDKYQVKRSTYDEEDEDDEEEDY